MNSGKSFDHPLKLAPIFALAVACFAQSEVPPHRIGWNDLTAAGRALAGDLGFHSGSFASEVDAIEQSTQRRLSEGEMDHLVFYLLQSRSFTTQPPIEPASSAIRFVHSGAKATPAAVTTRIEDLAQALLRPRDDRQRYFSKIIPAGTAQTLMRREYARTMKFLYRKESECSQAQQPQQCIAELYQKRGHSSDTAPDASEAVAAALLWVAGHSPAPIQKVLIIGPGADFAPRTGFTDAASVGVYQPELVRKAVVAAKLGLSLVLLDCVDINARVLASASSVCDSTAKLNIVTERRKAPAAYDLIVATNVLLYMDTRELLLAFHNIRSMLSARGLFIHNDPRFETQIFGKAVDLPAVHFGTVTLNERRTPVLLDRFVIHRPAPPIQ